MYFLYLASAWKPQPVMGQWYFYKCLYVDLLVAQIGALAFGMGFSIDLLRSTNHGCQTGHIALGACMFTLFVFSIAYFATELKSNPLWVRVSF